MVIDREQDDDVIMTQSNARLHSLLKISKFLDILKQADRIYDECVRTVTEYIATHPNTQKKVSSAWGKTALGMRELFKTPDKTKRLAQQPLSSPPPPSQPRPSPSLSQESTPPSPTTKNEEKENEEREKEEEETTNKPAKAKNQKKNNVANAINGFTTNRH